MTLANAAIISLLAVARPLVARAWSRPSRRSPVDRLARVRARDRRGAELARLGRDTTAPSIPGPLGVTFLFFLAGLEVDLSKLRGRLPGPSSACGCVLASPRFRTRTYARRRRPAVRARARGSRFRATGLGLVVPILRNADLARTPGGAQIIAVASVAEFAAVVVLALGFSSGSGSAGTVILLAALAAAAVVVTFLGARLRRAHGVTAVIDGVVRGHRPAPGPPQRRASSSASQRSLSSADWRSSSVRSSPAASSTSSTAR